MEQQVGGWTAFAAALPALPADITIDGFKGVSARLMTVTGSAPPFDVIVHITAQAAEDTRAASSSTLEVVYQLTPPGGGSPPPPPPHTRVIDYRGDMEIGGGTINVISLSDQPYQLYVDGNVSMSSGGINGIDNLLSTGSIKFTGGDGNFKKMHANCDVLVSNITVTIDHVMAGRNICMADTVTTKTIEANDSVTLAQVYADKIYAHATLYDDPEDRYASCLPDSKKYCTPNP